MPDVEVAEKKKRGRPRKEPAAPATETVTAESGEPVVKRGRGRPKGSTNKKGVAPKPTGPKRPRGRPKGSTKKKPGEDKAASPKKLPNKSSE